MEKPIFREIDKHLNALIDAGLTDKQVKVAKNALVGYALAAVLDSKVRQEAEFIASFA